MASLPENARRLRKETDQETDEAPSPQPVARGVSKMGGLLNGAGLKRLGGDHPNSAGTTKPAAASGTTTPAAEEAADERPPSPAEAARAAPRPSAPATRADTDDESAASKRLVSTGISGLDAQYGGGLPEGSLFLLTSEPTTATSVFAAQYAAAGLDAGETVHYISIEQPADAVREAIAAFVKDPAHLELLQVTDAYPSTFGDLPDADRKRLGLAQGDDPVAALERLVSQPDLGKVRILIESMTELLQQADAKRVFQALRLLRARVQRSGATAVVTLVEPLHDAHTVAQAKHLADGIVEFHVERKGFGIYPYIAVTKMRGVTGSARLLLFKETDSGLWLESTKRVF